MRFSRSTSFSLLNMHFAAVAILGIVNLLLLVELILAWHTLHAARPEELAQLRQQERVAQMQAAPLRDLPEKVKDASQGAERFYDGRVAGADSAIVAELGELAQKADVRITRLQYGYAPAVKDVTEVRMDASISGDYTPVMRFINSMERDRMFFVINGLTLTGQQGGLVNLRLRVTTYLRGADLDRAQPGTDDSSQESERSSGGA